MILWAGALYWQTGADIDFSLLQRLLVNVLLAGPLGIPIGLLWERDAFILGS
jgi:hypothetical protein